MTAPWLPLARRTAATCTQTQKRTSRSLVLSIFARFSAGRRRGLSARCSLYLRAFGPGSRLWRGPAARRLWRVRVPLLLNVFLLFTPVLFDATLAFLKHAIELDQIAIVQTAGHAVHRDRRSANFFQGNARQIALGGTRLHALLDLLVYVVEICQVPVDHLGDLTAQQNVAMALHDVLHLHGADAAHGIDEHVIIAPEEIG